MRRVLNNNLTQFSHTLPAAARTARPRFTRLCEAHVRKTIDQTPLKWRRFASSRIPTPDEPVDAREESSNTHVDTVSWGSPLADEELTDNATSNDITPATKQRSEIVREVSDGSSSEWVDIPIEQEESYKIADYRPKAEKTRDQKELDHGLKWLEQKEREKILSAAKSLQQKKEHLLMIRDFAIALLQKEEIGGVKQHRAKVTQLLHKMEDEDRHLEILFEQMADLLAVSYPELMRQSQPEQVDKLTALEQAEEQLNALLTEDMG